MKTWDPDFILYEYKLFIHEVNASVGRATLKL